jgi:hypothetical protein
MAAAKKAGKGGAPKEEPIDLEDTSADVDMDPRLIVSIATRANAGTGDQVLGRRGFLS